MNVVGRFTAVDGTHRVPLNAVQVRVPLSQARAALSRPPDFEDACVSAWGAVSRDEAEVVVACERDAACRDDLLAELAELFASAESHFVSLHYCNAYYGK
jgi:hypothetical protein